MGSVPTDETDNFSDSLSATANAAVQRNKAFQDLVDVILHRPFEKAIAAHAQGYTDFVSASWPTTIKYACAL